MTVPARLTFVTLGAHDLPTLRAFYKGLGWQEGVHNADDFASFLLNGVVLALYPRHLLAEEAAPGSTGPAKGEWTGITLSINAPTKDGVDAIWQAFVDAGATPIAAPVDRVYGVRSGYVADPEGNRWEVAWAPGLALDEQGNVVGFG
jgi:catechol 2,3-dioxygenase-like lactoylglutathione lyase family enzyme